MSKHHCKNWCDAGKRIAIYDRDNWTCVYCEKQYARGFLSLDHIIPASTFTKGDPNKNADHNLVTCCTACNNAKSDMPIHEFVDDIAKITRIIMRARNIKTNRKAAREYLASLKNAA